ncbi:putative ATP-binding cassette transporter [Azospirillum agricola]|uniref:ATP-binding cassette domain-containing protein n=1 Tax=Azospirillum agricola TaxID=1720247 RepID=UPI001AE61360|nr:ATP-binding cassette domain-containing protein [Azospirillum agricola]MBP2227813.1 putative ATP-binding cassette transporter [Azospirillum agricola]
MSTNPTGARKRPPSRPASALLPLIGLADRPILTRLVLTGCTAAVANLISLMSLSAELSGWLRGEVLDTPFLVFCLSLLVAYAFSKRFVSLLLTTAFSALAEVRRRFLHHVTLGGHADILDLQAKRSFDLGNYHLERIAALLPNLSIASNMMLVAAVAYLYLWTLTTVGATLLLVAAVFVGGWYVREAQKTRALLGEAKESEIRMLQGFSELVGGNAEIKLGKARRDELGQAVEADIAQWEELKRRHGRNLGDLFSWIATIIIGFSAVFVFIFPRMGAMSVAELPLVTSVILFLARPLSKFLNAVPDYVAAEDAASQLTALLATMPAAEYAPSRLARAPRRFKAIELRGIRFAYRAGLRPEPFEIGPVDLTIPAGSVVGIVGSNGSGKSTLLRVIPLLFRPDEGQVLLDGQPVETDRLESYRDLFCAVFQDHHIFTRLPQGPGFDAELFREMLDYLKIAHLVPENGEGLLNRELSKGQRRRLALAVAVAEGRPVIILDEWTSDQDAEFRTRFTNEIIGKLQSLGRTVIFVSHDGDVSSVCDVTIRMTNGRMSVPAPAAAPRPIQDCLQETA